MAADAKTVIVTKDLPFSSDMGRVGLCRGPGSWAAVGSGAVAVDSNSGFCQLAVGVERLVGQKLPQVPVTGLRSSFVTLWVTGRAHIQTGLSQEVGRGLSLGPFWKDHRNTLKDPLGPGGGRRNGGKVNEKQDEGQPVDVEGTIRTTSVVP